MCRPPPARGYGRPISPTNAVVVPAVRRVFLAVASAVAASGLSLQRVVGGAPAELAAVGAGEFVYPNGIARLKRVRDAAGAVSAVDYSEGGAGEAPRTQGPLPPR